MLGACLFPLLPILNLPHFPFQLPKKMLSCSIPASLVPPKSLFPNPKQRLPISKDWVLIRGHESKSNLCGRVWRIGVSEKMDMAEFVGFDAFKGSLFPRGWELREFESALNGMSKWLVVALLVFIILWKHNAESMWFATGSVVNSSISNTLKHVLNHDRPVLALRSDPGMPSSHAQNIFYTALYAILSLFHLQGMNAFTVSVGSILLIFGSYLSWLRVSQQLHTIPQVVAGAILGLGFSMTSYWMWHSYVMRAVDKSLWIQLTLVFGFLTFCVALSISLLKPCITDTETDK